MSGLRRLFETATTMAWALLVCAVLFASLRQWTIDEHRAVAGHPEDAPQSGVVVAFQLLCVFLFLIGLVVRVMRWLSARTAEAARRSRVESAHTFVGAPDRMGDRRCGPKSSRRLGRRG